MMKVVKFGGSSLADAGQFGKVADIIRGDSSRRLVVVSAPGKRFKDDDKVTDLLYACEDLVEQGEPFDDVFGNIRKRFLDIATDLRIDGSPDIAGELDIIHDNIASGMGRDYAASRGEYLNGLIMSAYLGYQFIDAAEVVLFNDDGDFNSELTNEMMAARLADVDRAVIPGFYGAYADGRVKTFSRGGSDITGSIVARAVRASVYENWTDVSGFLVADPRIIKNPPPIETITYRELRELSYMGASVLHEDAIFPVRKVGTPINIRNTNDPGDAGTWIVESTCKKSRYTITGIAGHKGFCAINVDKDMMNSEIGFGRKVLQAFEENGISFEHMPSGIDTLTVFVKQDDFMAHEQEVVSAIHRLASPDVIDIEPDLALIAVVGRGMKSMRGTAGRVFSALAHVGVNVKMIDQGSSELNIIIGVTNDDFEAAIKAIYDIFVETVV